MNKIKNNVSVGSNYTCGYYLTVYHDESINESSRCTF